MRRASLGGAPPHLLRPLALMVENEIGGVTLCSHVLGRFTHTHGRTHRRTQTNVHTDRQINAHTHKDGEPSWQPHRQKTGRQTDGPTDRQADRQRIDLHKATQTQIETSSSDEQ